MLVYHRVTLSVKLASTHLYTRVERGTVREHNTMPGKDSYYYHLLSSLDTQTDNEKNRTHSLTITRYFICSYYTKIETTPRKRISINNRKTYLQSRFGSTKNAQKIFYVHILNIIISCIDLSLSGFIARLSCTRPRYFKSDVT